MRCADARVAESRKEDSDKQRDDGDDNQQLDERKRAGASTFDVDRH